jgi:uncharacterized protein (TIGR03437 family)
MEKPMNSFSLRKISCTAIATAAIIFFAIAPSPAAAATVTYNASGSFYCTPPTPPATRCAAESGADQFELAGEPYSISIVGDEAMVPFSQGSNFAIYHGVKATATVTSGLVPTPVAITTTHTTMLLYTGNPSFDVLEFGTKIRVIKLTLTITAKVLMKKGTLTTPLISPFSALAKLASNTATLTYSDGTSSTTLGLTGAFTTTVSGAATTAAEPATVLLHTSGAQAITRHADGTKSVRSVETAPVDLGASKDVVALQFYASGVRDASEVRVQIAGQDVPVLYAGKAANFEGLDQISVLLPRRLAGLGEANVVLTVDGQTANPVRIRIQ